MAPKNQRWWLTEDSVELEMEADADVLYGMVSGSPAHRRMESRVRERRMGGRHQCARGRHDVRWS